MTGMDGTGCADELVSIPPRDSDPQELFLGPKKYLLWIFALENISWAQVTCLGVGIAVRR